MPRDSTISYKVYFNTRLKKVMFHGKETHPIYIQVIHDRTPIYFKSYFFDLLSKGKYQHKYADTWEDPFINEVLDKEEELLSFLAQIPREPFSLEAFKEDYNYYSKNLLEAMEIPFFDAIVSFFSKEDLPQLAQMTEASKGMMVGANLINDFKSSLNPQLFNKLLEKVSTYGPPYLPVYSFAQKNIHQGIVTFPIYQWEQYKDALEKYLKKEYPSYSFKKLNVYLNKLL